MSNKTTTHIVSAIELNNLGEKNKPEELKTLLLQIISEEKTVKALKDKKMIGIFE